MTAPPGSAAVPAVYARPAVWVVRETGNVARSVADSIDAGTYGSAEYMAAMTRLCNIALFGWLGFVEATMQASQLAGGAAPTARIVESDPIEFMATAQDRDVRIVTPFSRGAGDAIPDGLVSFVPRPVPAGASALRIEVDASDLPSGLYLGAIGLGPTAEQVVVPVELRL
jgi:hypothetical protein